MQSFDDHRGAPQSRNGEVPFRNVNRLLDEDGQVSPAKVIEFIGSDGSLNIEELRVLGNEMQRLRERVKEKLGVEGQGEDTP